MRSTSKSAIRKATSAAHGVLNALCVKGGEHMNAKNIVVSAGWQLIPAQHRKYGGAAAAGAAIGAVLGSIFGGPVGAWIGASLGAGVGVRMAK